MNAEAIAKFLDTLKVLHKTGDFAFNIFCGKCGSKNCQVIVFPDMWQNESGTGLVGIKCLDCGCSKGVDYGLDALYG